MDIRMDTESEEDAYEEGIMDDSAVEVVEEPIVPDEQMRMPPGAPKKPSRKKPLIIAAIVFLIIVFAFIGFIFIPRPPTDIDIIATESGDGHGMRLNALISSDSATESSGKASIKITYDGTEVYSNSNWKIDSNSDSITIPYSEFVMGNGVHNIEVEFEGVSDSEGYNVDFVIDDVDVAGENAQLDQNPPYLPPEFDLKVSVDTENDADPKNAEIKIVSIVHKEESYQITSGIGDWENLEGAQFTDTLEYQQSGNYTVTVEIRNGDVKNTAELYEEQYTGDIMINAVPKAVIETTEGDGNEDDRVALTGTTEERTIEFDATSSVDDSANNGHLVIYEWFFEDTQQFEYGEVVEHTFNTRNPSSDAQGKWTVSLTITDDGHGENGKTDTAFTLIEVTL
jgi:hypothetical protein